MSDHNHHHAPKHLFNVAGFGLKIISFILSIPRRIKFKLTAGLPTGRPYSWKVQNACHHRPLDKPVWHDSSDIGHMRPGDPVLGYYDDGNAWALPWWIMKNHHVANLELNGQFVLITLCELCSSSSAFIPVIDKQRYHFYPAGQYNGTILLSDTETGSYWSPFMGEALSGKLKGNIMKRIPVVQMLWSEWMQMHPNTQVLYGDQAQREGHGSIHSPGSPQMADSFNKTLCRPMDKRLPHNQLVLGVENQAGSKAYPLDKLDISGPILHTSIGDEEIVIFHPTSSFYALAFSSLLDGSKLEFEWTEAGEIIDKQTGSTWNFSGEAYQGPHKGKKLRFVDSSVEEWFAFAAYHPDCEIH